MIDSVTAYVIYKKRTKNFYSRSEEGLVERLSEASLYSSNGAKEELNKMDEPEDFEIWEIVLTFQTL